MGVFCWFLGISRVLAMADEQEFWLGASSGY